jgi:hypothetical protein
MLADNVVQYDPNFPSIDLNFLSEDWGNYIIKASYSPVSTCIDLNLISEYWGTWIFNASL